MTNNILTAVNLYQDIFSDVLTSENVLERFTCYYQTTPVPLWNTAFHNNTYYSYEDILKLNTYYKLKNIQGYFLSFDNKYQEFSIYNGSFFYLSKNSFNQDFLIKQKISVKEIKDCSEYCKYLSVLFEIDLETEKELCAMLSLKDRKYKNKNFCAYIDGVICATITITLNEFDNAYISNLAVFPEFRKKNLASLLIHFLIQEFCDKNIYTLTAKNSVLSQFSLPNLGFQNMGEINLIPLEKMNHTMQNF
ncbi:GNAT family N-acetyltransferase [Pigmentibacter sp. JX0631]|uniref:GNAT family N-acetyltransferase n=1 Tax=Pigmentibacter sp. JX0631 TaxID=2976982 RepID=UPI0024684C75|nr:GNAT family N-acetyltransferase [Pigmentibacter sp. JX0631]WGL60009.1 GNAT family N-acetyltransferase [Pigmentibacter sp. JX0631]